LGHGQVTTLGKLFTPMYLLPRGVVWYWPRGSDGLHSAAGKVTLGPASHWPWVRDFGVYPFTSSMA